MKQKVVIQPTRVWQDSDRVRECVQEALDIFVLIEEEKDEE